MNKTSSPPLNIGLMDKEALLDEIAYRYLETVPVSIIVKTPVKATSQNATTVVSDTEYRWDTTLFKPITVNLTFEKDNQEAIAQHQKKIINKRICVALVVVILLILLCVFKLFK